MLICIALGVATWTTLRADLLRNSRIVAGVLAQNAAPTIQFEDPVAALEVLSALSGHPEVFAAELVRTDGELFAFYRRPTAPGPDRSLLPEPMARVAVSVPVEAEGVAIGELRLSIAMARIYQQVVLAVSCILLVVLVVLGLVLLLQARLFARLLVLGRPCTLLFAPGSGLVDGLPDRLQESSTNGLSLDECKMIKADGTDFCGHSVIIPVAPGLAPDGYAMVIRNITNQRQSMNSLLHAATWSAMP